MRRSLPLAVLALAASACAGSPSVARMVDGRDVSGRFISEEAYAEFLAGAAAESGGDLRAALEHYRATVSEDPDSSEAWARLGVVACRVSPAEADRALARSLSAEPNLAAPYVGAAECALLRGQAPRAVRAARSALERDPDAPETTDVYALALERAGDAEGATRLRRAAELRLGLSEMGPTTHPSALIDDPDARREPRLPRDPAAVALRSLERGDPETAANTAARGLVSDPGDATLRALSLAAADLAGNAALYERVAGKLPPDRTSPSPAALRELEALLARRVGDAAAKAFHDASAQ